MSDVVELERDLRLIRAPNPSPMTFTGTNTYLLGRGPFAVIDPGPASDTHLRGILDATGGRITDILVTHAHLDHSPLARALSAETGAPVCAFGDARAGRSGVMQTLGDPGGGEGVDHDFRPDVFLEDGDEIGGAGWRVTALWTPGHFCNHLSFVWRDVVFTGDLVMGWASSLVSPPDGDLTQFMASCRRLLKRDWRRFYPGHGAPVGDPAGRLEWLIAHRLTREAQILASLAAGPATPAELASRIYRDHDPHLLPAAVRNVFAHLVDLAQRNRVECDAPVHHRARFRLS